MKPKMKLDQLKVDSFLTSEAKQVKGGTVLDSLVGVCADSAQMCVLPDSFQMCVLPDSIVLCHIETAFDCPLPPNTGFNPESLHPIFCN